MSDAVQQIVSKLSSLLEIRYIYLSKAGPKDHDRSLFIVIVKGNCPSMSHELSAMVAKIFQDETDFLYRIFPYEFALQQLREGKLFFAQGCAWSNLIYNRSDRDLDLFDHYKMDERTLNIIRSDFDKELEKINGFIEGAEFFYENKNLAQSTFLWHQVIELLFRSVELFTMGKERKSHTIKEHQSYIRAFIPELGDLFDVSIEGELFLLKLLDEAYLATRYNNNYAISVEQFRNIRDRADEIYAIVLELFEERIKECQKELNDQNDMEPIDFKTAPTTTISNDEKLIKLEYLVNKHFRLLKPYENRDGIFKMELTTEGYLDTAFIITNLLKVCILAMYTDDYPQRLIPQPEHNVQEVLKLVLELIPMAEMELLDNLRDLV